MLCSNDKIDRILINLKVLATIAQGERITVYANGSFSIYQSGWLQSLSRRTFGETRWGNLDSIKTVISEAINILQTYINLVDKSTNLPSSLPYPTLNSCVNYIKTFSKELEAVKSGLENLKVTYEADSLMVANLNLLIERTQTEVSKGKEVSAKFEKLEDVLYEDEGSVVSNNNGSNNNNKNFKSYKEAVMHNLLHGDDDDE